MFVEAVWYSNALWAQGIRAILTPFSWIFCALVAVRNRMYRRGGTRVTPSSIPVVSVGNLSVGGTGKTPFAAWLVAQLQQHGGRPAIVMRGYGDDEPLVHRLLSPNVPVYTGADRVALIARAAGEGATVVVLDDGFQHRRAGRSADIVLLSADAWPQNGEPRMLPAGPFREPMSSLRRASLAVITSKAASLDAIARVQRAVRDAAPGLPIAVVTFALRELVDAVRVHDGDAGHAVRRLPLSALKGESVLAIAGIGAPRPFFAQLRSTGAIVSERSFNDHYAFTAADVASFVAASKDHKYVISTLKDAVKLAPKWPAKDGSLWYVSQAVEVNEGMSFIETLALDILSRRRP